MTMKRKNVFFLIVLAFLIVPKIYGQYFIESFEGSWNGSPPVPSGWSIIHTPASGGGGGDDPIYWAQNTWNGSSWSVAGTGLPLPSGAKDGSSVAWYNDSYAKATQKDMLCSGNIDLSSSITPWVTFYLSINSQSTLILKLKASSNGGLSWNEIQTISSPGLEWTKIRIVLPSYCKVSTARIGFEVTASYGSYDVWLDKVVVEEKPAPLTGTKTIKVSNGDFSTFSSAFEALNDAGVGTGGVIFNVDAGFTSTEFCPALTVSGSSNASITFQKNGIGNNPKIIAGTGISVVYDAIIRLYGCDYVTFDGIDVAENPVNTNDKSRMEYGYSIKNISSTDGAQYNTIKNCQITLNRAYNSTKGVGQDSLIKPTSPSGSNSYNKFQNIKIQNSYHGIYIVGNNNFPDIGIEISGCTIGANTANDIGNGSQVVNGIRITSGSNVIVFGNEVRNVTVTGSSNIFGIFLEYIQGTNYIFNNSVHDVKSTSTSTSSLVYGIRTDINSGSTCNVYNNIIFALTHGVNSPNPTIYIRGIAIGMNGTGTGNFYYNSVRIDEDQNPSSACFYTGAYSTVNLLNNVFANFSTAGLTSKRYCLYCGSGSLNNVDYNDYCISSGTNNFIGYYSSTDISDLSTWRTNTGKDRYSISADPGFTSTTNLQPDVNNVNSWNINGKGYPISTVSDDYAGNSRSTSLSSGAPDIGAYEFTPSVTPSDATQSGTIGDGNTTSYTVAGNIVASITWHGANLPSSISTKYYSGSWPNNTPNGSQFGNVYFDITPTGGSGYTYDLTLYYTPGLLGTISGESYLRLAHYTGGSWNQHQLEMPNTTNKSITVNGLSSFSAFAFGDANAPLPLLLSVFSGRVVNGRDVEMKWKTTKEYNNKGFEIERSLSGKEEWKTIDFVKGMGTKESETEYNYIDRKLNSGKYKYRLKQIDNNGFYNYYEMAQEIEIGLPGKYDLSQNYPNPYNPLTKIDYALPFDSKVEIIIFDITGREIKKLVSEAEKAGYYTVEFNGSALASGVYFYRMIAEGNGQKYVMTKKMVLVK